MASDRAALNPRQAFDHGKMFKPMHYPVSLRGLTRVITITGLDNPKHTDTFPDTEADFIYYGSTSRPQSSLKESLESLLADTDHELHRVTRNPSRKTPAFGEVPQDNAYAIELKEQETDDGGLPIKRIIAFCLTVLTTLHAGALWHQADLASLEIFGAAQFAAAVLFVLGTHELGHYVTGKHYSVHTSLPLFIPVPNLIGTLGAIIAIDDLAPDNKALFDIGVAGPLAGLAATMIVTVVGVFLPPVTVPESGIVADVSLSYPPLIKGIAWLVGQPIDYPAGMMANPVLVAAWLGCFLTFLNLIPVGQLDGGHMLHALFGEWKSYMQLAFPPLLGALFVITDSFIWLVWGVLLLLFLTHGSMEVVRRNPLSPRRKVVAAVTFILGVLCFTPVPITTP